LTEKKTPNPYTPSILVVDDDPDARCSLRRTLEEAGYLVVEAENGREVGNPGQDERDSGMIPNGVPG